MSVESWSNATEMHAAQAAASWRCSRSALDGGNATLTQCLSSPDIEAAAFNCPTCAVPVECELPAGKADWSYLPPMGDRGDGWVVNDWGQYGCPSDCFRMSNRFAKGLRKPGLENGEGCFRGCDPRTAWQHGFQDRINWCTVCWDDSTGTFDTKNGEGREKAFIDGMGPFDWCALWLAAALVALTVVGELKDLMLCKFAINHAVEAGNDPGKGWRFAFGVHRWIRKWIFLPALIQCVPRLIGNKGGDALNVSLNTVSSSASRGCVLAFLFTDACEQVAVLFLAEVDNAFYALALSERTKVRVEEAGRVVLTEDERTSLQNTKTVFLVIVFTNLIVVVSYGLGGWHEQHCEGRETAECGFFVRRAHVADLHARARL